MALQDRLEALRMLPPSKLMARAPSWYKTHQRNTRGADCLKPLPTIKPYPVYVVKPPTLGPADSARDIVFSRACLHASMTTAEYIAEFQRAAFHKGI
jgi:hypothetical protein